METTLYCTTHAAIEKLLSVNSDLEAGRIAGAASILGSASARFKPKSRGVPERLQCPPRSLGAPGLLRWNAQVLADFLGQVVVDFGVARDRRSLTCGPVNVDRMIGSLAQQFAPVPFEVSNEFATLHALTFSGSRITSFPEAAS